MKKVLIIQLILTLSLFGCTNIDELPSFDGEQITHSLSSSIVQDDYEVFVAMTGNLSPVFAAILMPASSISVVLFVVLMSNFLAKKRGLL